MTSGRIINESLSDQEIAPNAPYLFQTIHTLHHKGRHLHEHLTLLNQASQHLFNQPVTLSATDLQTQISELLVAEHYPTTVSSFVRLQVYASGVLKLVLGEISLYAGYALRSLQPEAITLTYDLPFGGLPLSLREQAAAIALCQAQAQGATAVIRSSGNGLVCTADDAPLFVVRGTQIYTPVDDGSVEFAAAIAAIHLRGYELHIQAIETAELSACDEIFYFDHRGITALSKCNGRLLMHILAEQVATVLR
ncbi:MAG: branched-chain amino acid aminotransferase [Alistipes sp.]